MPGYIKKDKVPYRHKETPEELWRRAMLSTPITLSACQVKGEVHVGRLKKIDDELLAGKQSWQI